MNTPGNRPSREELLREIGELEKRERFFRDIIEGQSELIFRFLPNGTLTYVNQSFANYFGRRKSELPGVSFLEFIPSEERYKILKFLDSFGPDRPTASLEHIVTNANGELRWQQWSSRALFGESGGIKEFQAVGRDITTRKIVEEALIKVTSEKEAYRVNLEAVFRSIPDGILTVDDKMRVIDLNKSTHQICRLFENLMPGDSLDELVCNRQSECCTVLRQTLKTKSPVKEYRVDCMHGRPEQVVVLNAAPLLSANNAFMGAVLLIRDISRLAALEKRLVERHRFQSIVGKSEPMQRVYSLLEQLSDVDTTVLVTGESGTGKELVADALHYGGSRAKGPLVKVNCSALSENLLESELFGHVKGSFTGAVQDKAGRFEAAQGGTILLDEIGDLSPRIQLKLLRVLERKEFERVGENRTRKADVRVVAATNVDLPAKVREGLFREDLYYRLKVVVIALPALRDRKEDIPILANHFLDSYRAAFRKNISAISPGVMEIFMRYPWPGNVRELKHTLEHACILCPEEEIGLADLPAELLERAPATGRSALATDRKATAGGKEAILSALESTDWNKAKAARLLGMSRRTLYRKLDRYGIGDRL